MSAPTKYTYSAAGDQIVRKNLDGTVALHLAGHDLNRGSDGSNLVATRYCSAGGLQITVRTGGDEPLYTASDVQAFTGHRGFLNQPVNMHAKLVDTGVRKYDRVTARFLSVDPVLDPSLPEQNNGYNYGGNNPLTRVELVLKSMDHWVLHVVAILLVALSAVRLAVLSVVVSAKLLDGKLSRRWLERSRLNELKQSIRRSGVEILR